MNTYPEKCLMLVFWKLNPLRLSSFPSVCTISYMRMRWLGHAAHVRDKRNVYVFLVGKTKGKRSIGWPRLKKENNIKVNKEESGPDSSCTGHTKLAVYCKFGNKLSDSRKYGIFFFFCIAVGVINSRKLFGNSVYKECSSTCHLKISNGKNYASFCMNVPVLTPILGWKVFVPRGMRYLILEVSEFGSTPILFLVFITLTRF